MADAPKEHSSAPRLPPEAIALAGRLFDAARMGDVLIIHPALTAGLPANLTNSEGNSLLMLAAYNGQAGLVSLLIQHGTDPNQLNDRGQSPLAGAIYKKEDLVIEALLEGGADPEYGSPSAMQSIEMFKQVEKWGEKFRAAPGKGKASERR
ncbi:putative ankyrin repeat protein PA3287 [Ceratocystis fimbriata CBS 114723]|uniref:Putative ankyrin repeat protein PA3287 n=1 Tax=Ceratocystis fimbriata CBS 114723 TaxID=1035309 RepID=A0A2C5WWF6_9PEZI|nr:putative ankyrin repeat protein PA3287 [Ceratocystis fimbriata CBS 114723]